MSKGRDVHGNKEGWYNIPLPIDHGCFDASAALQRWDGSTCSNDKINEPANGVMVEGKNHPGIKVNGIQSFPVSHLLS